MLKQAFYILFFYFTGEFISSFIDGFIPGSVIGMILLFLAGVGLMTSLGVISQYWAVILTASVVSTILVIASVALIQQKLGKEGGSNE